jgi:hypothetical protein
LLHAEIIEMYDLFLASLIGGLTNNSATQAIIKDAIEVFCDWQGKQYLFKELPEDYTQELEGIEQAGQDFGSPSLGKTIKCVLVLANAPGDLQDFILVRTLDSQKAIIINHALSGHDSRDSWRCHRRRYWQASPRQGIVCRILLHDCSLGKSHCQPAAVLGCV